jgi:hypothetical protein
MKYKFVILFVTFISLHVDVDIEVARPYAMGGQLDRLREPPFQETM